ncbi:MAG: DoxX family protein [Planctomycetia bacterium]|nr:DoxX family protein [Planctomycetia bacterium]
MAIVKTVLKFVLGLFFVGAGEMHFLRPEFYLKIMPPYLPWHWELVFVSGVFEVALGVLLLIPLTTRLAAWGLIALLIAIFPANIYVYQNQELIPDFGPTMHLVRLPLQGVLILWAWWYTRPDRRV